jgi:ATP-dependent RNA helicase DDX49/DBP8
MEDFLRRCEISKPVTKAVLALAYKQPTAVQLECIPKILKGESVAAKAPTGTGKTAAFAIPIVELLSRDPYSVFAVVITPTRELALQIADQFQAFGSQVQVRVACVTGGLDIVSQTTRLLDSRPHVIVATPGRLLSLLDQLDIRSLFANLEFLVLDECDFLQESQAAELAALMKGLQARRELRFSATLDEGPTLGQRAGIEEKFVLVPAVVKDVYLWRLLLRYAEMNVIVFTQACADAQVLSQMLQELGVEALAMHSLMSQAEREHSLRLFRSARQAVLVATDVAARGLDLPQVQLVINHNVPRSSKLYLHRVGRTARAGRSGLAITLVTQFEVGLVLHIEKKLHTKLTDLLTKEEATLLEDEVLDSMTKTTNAKAVVIHVI